MNQDFRDLEVAFIMQWKVWEILKVVMMIGYLCEEI
jgi:hypothetical protein